MSKISLFTVAAVAAALCSPIEAQTQSLDASVDASLGARSMRALKTERVRRPREEDPPRERRERRIETRERRPRRERGSKGGSEEMPSGEVSEDDALADFNAEGPMAVGGDYNDMGAPVGGPAMAVDIDIDTYSSGDDEYDAGFDEEEYGGAAGPTGEADTGGSTRSLMEPTSAEDVGTFETEEFEAPAAVPEEFPTSGEEYADEYEMPAEGPVEEPTMDTDSAGPAAGGDYDGMMPAGGDYDGMMPGEPVEESGEYEMMPVEGPLGEMFGDPEMVYEYDAAAPHAEGPFSDDYGMAPNSDEYGMAPFSDEYGMAPFSDGYAAAPFSDYQEISESEYDEMIPTDEETTRGATGGTIAALFLSFTPVSPQFWRRKSSYIVSSPALTGCLLCGCVFL